MVTVEELLNLPVLRRLKLLAGKKGLNRRVSCLTVMEVPDVIRWLRGNDFLITSLYALKDDVNKQLELIDKLADCNCSCLAVKLGQYVKELDPSILKKADERGLVLVEIPRDMTYIEIIVNGMEKIIHNRDIVYIVEKYMKDIILDNYKDDNIMIERGELLGFKINEGYSLAMTLLDQNSDLEKINKLRRLAKEVAKKSDVILKFTYNPVVTIDGKSTILLFSNKKAEISNNLDKIIDIALDYLNREGFKDVRLGIGSLDQGIEGIKKSYYSSLEVLRLSNILEQKTNVYHYEDLKMYLLLNEVFKNKDYEIFDDIEDKLGQDLIMTLEKFYESNMDIRQTANNLYVHQNTVRYRLKKVFELTGYDINKFEDNFKLYLFLFYKRVKGLRG